MGRHKGEHPPTRDEYEDCADDLHDVREVGVPARRDEKRWVIFSVESVLTIPTRGIETNYWLSIILRGLPQIHFHFHVHWNLEVVRILEVSSYRGAKVAPEDKCGT